MICIETIKKRKAVYGNNFPEIARLQSEYFKREFTPQDVAMNIYNTKIDDMVLSMDFGLPKFTRKEKLDHYCKKLQLVWEGRLCLE